MEVLCFSEVSMILWSRYPTPKIYDLINDEDSFYLSPG